MNLPALEKIEVNKKGKVVDTFASFTKPDSKKFLNRIEIEAKNKKKGKVNIFYTTSDELETIISKIKS